LKHAFNPDCIHPPKTAEAVLPQASNKYINHETLQYKCFETNIKKKPVFSGLYGIINIIDDWRRQNHL